MQLKYLIWSPFLWSPFLMPRKCQQSCPPVPCFPFGPDGSYYVAIDFGEIFALRFRSILLIVNSSNIKQPKIVVLIRWRGKWIRPGGVGPRAGIWWGPTQRTDLWNSFKGDQHKNKTLCVTDVLNRDSSGLYKCYVKWWCPTSVPGDLQWGTQWQEVGLLPLTLSWENGHPNWSPKIIWKKIWYINSEPTVLEQTSSTQRYQQK